MNETRKKIILNEIKYWKKSKLLPEQYCDFLLTLYSGGEEAITPLKKERSHSIHIPIWIFTVLFFTILFVNYFTEIAMGLQITLTALAIIIFGYFIYRYFENALLYQLALVCIALLILIESVNFTDFMFPDNNGILYVVLLMQCAIWFILGRKLKLMYFSISGILGGIVIIFVLAKSLM